ncbi:hypothetical protein SCLCIDRAFT_8804 [Scleroderma citrinum Foug A]|uniref:Uncharacterized protein n=1 Tax=Scleroderma citrinum Foug A TaxID=1036808 RepID=A0A0C3E648_9AGAM|nr:hypothetical protein SCLCIDRAFT_8804 [Scleroderma citrinum Foug A]
MSFICVRNWLEQQNLFPVDKLWNWDVLPAAIYYTAYATALAVTSAFTLVRFLKTFLVFAQTFILRGRSLKTFGAGKGAWSSPALPMVIGKEFALQLASAGFNTLVAHNQVMLSNVADEIGPSGPLERSKLIGFVKNDPDTLRELKTLLRSLDIGVLENEEIVTIHVDAMVRMTHAVLLDMIERKAFVTTFTSALAEEVKAYNITVQPISTPTSLYACSYIGRQCPADTHSPVPQVSKMSKIAKSSAMVPIPSAYVRASLGKIGLACGAAMTDRPNTVTRYSTST